jgi:hypothetical protein
MLLASCGSRSGPQRGNEDPARIKVVILNTSIMGARLQYKVKIPELGVVAYTISDYPYSIGDTLFISKRDLRY